MKNSLEWKAIEQLLEEMIAVQSQKLLASAKKIVPHITFDDLLQPNDFPELEHHPLFRHEEGILAGMQTAFYALRAFRCDQESR